MLSLQMISCYHSTHRLMRSVITTVLVVIYFSLGCYCQALAFSPFDRWFAIIPSVIEQGAHSPLTLPIPSASPLGCGFDYLYWVSRMSQWSVSAAYCGGSRFTSPRLIVNGVLHDVSLCLPDYLSLLALLSRCCLAYLLSHHYL